MPFPIPAPTVASQMDRRRLLESDAASPPRPPFATPSPFLRDVSNFRTPKSHHLNPSIRPPASPLPILFTASKKTPSSVASSARRRTRVTSHPATGSLCEATRRRLKTLELEQSRSSRKNQTRRERNLKSFALSISAWLNFLLRNPSSCGCHTPAWSGGRQDCAASIGKRESFEGGEIGVGRQWRSPKRQRNCSSLVTADDDAKPKELQKFSSLEASLKDVCSFEDLKERLELYMSRKSCKEVLLMMSQVCKNIDEGRLKIKANCPLVTELGLKEKATKTLMCYNPIWLRVGLHIVFGGDSLLLNEEEKLDRELLFLRVIIETQFYSHVDIAKSYAYNKLVEGLYKPGYYEALGSIILKRFLLLVVSLDKAKCECALPSKYGIDSIDGGSPLLFNSHSHIKSSQQIINEFLSEVMHGEGNLLAHLQSLGFRVNHQQIALSEYDFSVKNIFEDIQDGVLLSRAIQLLQHDASILSNLMAPPITGKKKLRNCDNVMKYLKKAGLSLCDVDGTQILSEDIANGDKEFTLSILWNIFVNLQIPLLIERTSLVGEIVKLKKSHTVNSDYTSITLLGLLLEWIQVVCKRYDIKVDGLSSLVDGKALCCLIHHYSNDNFENFSSKENQDEYNKCLARFSDISRTSALHNLVLVQRFTTVMGNFPGVLQLSDLLEDDVFLDERSITILLVFLASLLTCRKDLDRGKLYSLMRWDWSPDYTPPASPLSTLTENSQHTKSKSQRKNKKFSSPEKKGWLGKYDIEEWAAKVVQTQFRRYIVRKKFLKIKTATCILQSAIRAWLTLVLHRKSFAVGSFCSVSFLYPVVGQYNRHTKLMIDRHTFVGIKKSVLLIQNRVRAWIQWKHQRVKLAPTEHSEPICADWENLHQKAVAVITIQNAWRTITLRKCFLVKRYATIKIQSHWRAWCMRMNFIKMVKSATKIQACTRCMLRVQAFNRYKLAATIIQKFVRGHLARNSLLGASSIQFSKLCFALSNSMKSNNGAPLQLKIVICAVLKIQRWWKQLLYKRKRTAVIFVQSFIRGWQTRKAANKLRHSIFTIQRWWRNVLFRESRRRSVLIIQSHFRGWITRRAIGQQKHSIILIQSYWKGYLVKKQSKQILFDLQRKLKSSHTIVEDDMQLINRLVAALPELFACRSISNLRQICAMLSNATEHSQTCCEALVAAGAIDTLLRQIPTLNRGFPDQEVLKHVLSTLRNIVHYPQLLQAFRNAPRWGEIIFQEMLRNKNEGFFICCDLLKRLCSTPEGRETIRNLKGHVRRLNVLAQGLERKVELQKRNAGQAVRLEITIRRRAEAVKILRLILGNHS